MFDLHKVLNVKKQKEKTQKQTIWKEIGERKRCETGSAAEPRPFADSSSSGMKLTLVLT